MLTQFIRIEEYSRTKKDIKQRDVSGILAEANRKPSHSRHVESPDIKRLYGYKLDKVEKILEDAFETKVNGKKVRKDARILLSGVASFPVAYSESPDEAILRQWRNKTIKFLKEEFGSNLKSVIEHKDEAYPHLHFYCFDEKVMNLKGFHPGMLEEQKSGSKSKKSKHRAFVNGLIGFQDKYYKAVSSKFDIARSSDVKRERLDRKAILEINRLEQENKKEKEAQLTKAIHIEQMKKAGLELNKRKEVSEEKLKNAVAEIINLEKENQSLKTEVTRLNKLVSELKNSLKIAFDAGIERAAKAFKRMKKTEKEYTPL